MTDTVQVPREATEEMKRMGARAFAGLERYARDYEYVDAQLSPKFAQVWWAMLAAAPQATDPRDGSLVSSLYDAIAHGDEQHREWLRAAIDAHFAGKPVPPVAGLGSREAIATLTAERDDYQHSAKTWEACAESLHKKLRKATRERDEVRNKCFGCITPAEYSEALDELTAERDALRDALKLLHDNIVQAFPSLANLGPVAQARALTTHAQQDGDTR